MTRQFTNMARPQWRVNSPYFGAIHELYTQTGT